MVSESVDCKIYRCSKKDEMYLYIREDYDLEALPSNLTAVLGSLTHVMDLTLTPERTLARENVESVMAGLNDTGYYVQLAPDVTAARPM